MVTVIKIVEIDNRFAQNKDAARELRIKQILPAIHRGDDVVLDFAGIENVTQSFVHALIGEVCKQLGEAVLDRVTIHDPAPQVLTVIELVIDYSLGGFDLSNLAD
jgi:hypothetical protein